MSTRSAEYLEAVDHLPVGATLVFRQVSWERYEELLEDLADRPGLRVSYDEGRLEINRTACEVMGFRFTTVLLAGIIPPVK